MRGKASTTLQILDGGGATQRPVAETGGATGEPLGAKKETREGCCYESGSERTATDDKAETRRETRWTRCTSADRKSRTRAHRRHGCLAALPEASAAPAPAVNTGDDLGVAGRAARQTRRRLLIEIASQALAAGRVMLAHAGCRTPSRALCYLRRAIINRTPLI